MNNWFRIVGRLEALSFLLLLVIAMPLKYYLSLPIFVRVMGPLHGALFLAYCSLAFILALNEEWPWKKHLFAYVAAIVPCGTLWFEKNYDSARIGLNEN